MTSLTDWQARVRSLTVGAGTSYEFSGPIGGLGGIPKARTNDSPRGDRIGEVGGKDTLPRRILTLPLNIDATVSGVWPLRDALIHAWGESAFDTTLDIRLPGMSEPRRFYGRTRGADVDLDSLKGGHVDALCTFEALDPLGYGEEVVVELEGDAGPLTIDVAGTAATDRIIATIVGNGEAARLERTDHSAGFIQLVDDLAADVELEFDFRERNVVDGDGLDQWPLVANLSQWFRLRPADNTLELTGAASAEITYRPAFR